MTELHKATEAEIEPLLTRILAAAATHLPEAAEDWTTLRTRWLSLYQAASGGRGKLTDAAGERRDARTALATQLTRNLLTLALHFLGRPEKAAELFDESRLRNPQRSGQEPTDGEPAPTT